MSGTNREEEASLGLRSRAEQIPTWKAQCGRRMDGVFGLQDYEKQHSDMSYLRANVYTSTNYLLAMSGCIVVLCKIF